MLRPVSGSDFGCVTLQSCHKSNVSRWQSWASFQLKLIGWMLFENVSLAVVTEQLCDNAMLCWSY